MKEAVAVGTRRVGFLEGRLVRRVTRGDFAWWLAICALAAATLVVGRRASQRLPPTATPQLASMLDNLEMPTRVPDAPLRDTEGKTISLRDRITGARAVLAFYAPWCGPCQKELPMLVTQVGTRAPVLVIVGPDEDVEETKQQLANLGVELSPLVDVTGVLARESKVTALPTTFLVTREGAVLLGSRGYSWLSLYRIKQRLSAAASDSEDP